MKTRVNWTISREAYTRIKQAQKLSNPKKSISELVDFAINTVFKNKVEYLKEIARKKAQELAKIQEQIKDLEK